METKDKVFYAIDMGSPTKGGGFFCWRWDGEELTPYEKNIGWNSCIAKLIEDCKEKDVHLTIEAPLWGTKDDDGCWKQRFTVEIDEGKFTEVHWYTQSGGSVGLMAQEFLGQLIESINNYVDKSGKGLNPKEILTQRKIKLYESYISGVRSVDSPKDESIRKKGSIIKIIKKTDNKKISKAKKDDDKDEKSTHVEDAYEQLLLLMEKILNEKKFPDELGEYQLFDQKQLEDWGNKKSLPLDNTETKADNIFCLGVLKKCDFFELQNGKIGPVNFFV